MYSNVLYKIEEKVFISVAASHNEGNINNTYFVLATMITSVPCLVVESGGLGAQVFLTT